MINSVEDWMRAAIAEAEAARAKDEVPIGCVIVHEPTGNIVGSGHNLRETAHDATAHAEIIAIRQACAALSSWRLIDCTLVVTLEPCTMCAGAAVLSRVARVVYGSTDLKAGAAGSVWNALTDPRLNHRPEVVGGVCAVECGSLLKRFFAARR